LDKLTARTIANPQMRGSNSGPRNAKCGGKLNLPKLSQKALSLIQAADLLISPMAVVELQYLYDYCRPRQSERGRAAVTRDETIRENYSNARW
jgi:hypothetical protein